MPPVRFGVGPSYNQHVEVIREVHVADPTLVNELRASLTAEHNQLNAAKEEIERLKSQNQTNATLLSDMRANFDAEHKELAAAKQEIEHLKILVDLLLKNTSTNWA